MKKTLLLTALVLLINIAHSQETEVKKKRFIGGMVVHSGYLENSRSQDNISGVCYGIGGQMAFRFGKHFRLGTEGYASNFSYKNNEGQYKLGWGGLLVGYQLGNKKWKPVLSLTLGGGKVKDMYFVSGNVSDDYTDNVRYRVYSDMLVSPSVGIEYALKSNLSLVMKADYIIPVFSDNYTNYAYGPRIYVGILFNK